MLVINAKNKANEKVMKYLLSGREFLSVNFLINRCSTLEIKIIFLIYH